MLINVLLIN